MSQGAIASTLTGIISAVVLCATGFVFLLSLGLALNGFMGQERAVNASFGSYFVLAAITGLLSLVFGCWLAYYLTTKRLWHWAGSSILSIFVASLVGGVLHFFCVIIATIVASSLRTGPK